MRALSFTHWQLCITSLLLPKWRWKLLSHVWLFATPWTIQSMGWILQARIPEWIAYPFPSRSSLPMSWTGLLHCRAILYQLSYQGSPASPQECYPKKEKSHSPSLRVWGTGLFLMAMSAILDCSLLLWSYTLLGCFLLVVVVVVVGWLVWEGKKNDLMI